MPKTVIADPTPSWLKPGSESVLDSTGTKILRALGRVIGADDPGSQVQGVLTSGTTAGVGGLLGKAKQAIKAYHGSPHDFDKFSIDKAGTGEGAQAYGHGLYFAENEDVARRYRDLLSKKAAGGQGHMYEVAINADPEWLLDWDRPISQQSEAVRGALAPSVEYLKSRPLVEKVRARLESGQATGHDIYLWLSGEKSFDKARQTWPAPMQNPNVLGTAAMKEAGIPGIKYLDQGSRSVGEGTRNFVVFDDATVEVLKKWGLLPAAVSAKSLNDSRDNPKKAALMEALQ